MAAPADARTGFPEKNDTGRGYYADTKIVPLQMFR
jgi:hypothetical protein